MVKHVNVTTGNIVLANEAWSLWRPASKITLSQWSDRYRILSSESSAEPGRWITQRAPYQKEIMDAISDPWVPKVVCQKGSQLGITDCLLNAIGYFATEDPAPILLVTPTIETSETFSTDRLQPMLRDTPRLRGLVADPRSKDSSNTLRKKTFAGGFIALAGGNSASSLSGRPIRILLLDEVDRFGLSAGAEGNPIQLAVARTSAFWNRKIVIVSSPSISGASHVEREIQYSDQRRWFLPCPSCGFMQVLAWDRIRFSDYQHSCSECGLFAPKYRWLAGRGEWRATQTHDKLGRPITTAGFYLSGLVNPWLGWDVLGLEFARANRAVDLGDIEPLKVWKNTRLGELWKIPSQRIETDLSTHYHEYEY
jgi:phage terminase large subunit GpA-like protein